ncbi:MAG: M20/M25/M40 family metallo-hydrolase [Thermoleophilia bacterium]
MSAAGDAARAAAADAPEVLAAWARQPSGSGDPEGLAAMAGLVLGRAAALGGTPDLVDLPGGGAAVRVTRRWDAPFRVLLVGHHDTVHGPAFPGPPVETRDGGVLTGPGVADMKGGILVMLAALAGLEASAAAPGLGWRLLLTPDEELGAPRSRDLLVAEAAEADAGLVFEPAPAGGGVVVARRGRRVLEVEARGRAAHAGRDPSSGRNAVTALAEVVLAAEALADPDAGTDVTVGTFSGGSAVNVVPDAALAAIDVRSGSEEALEAVQARIAEAAAVLGAHREVAVTVRCAVGCPPMPGGDRTAALAARYARAHGDGAEPRAVGGVSDANHLAGAGLPVLDGLGPLGGGLHGMDEWVDTGSIAHRAAAAAAFLEGLAAEPPWRGSRPIQGAFQDNS